ncbi:MAG TPA: serpin family protein [Coleofasciculaceae cyanobacterium]
MKLRHREFFAVSICLTVLGMGGVLGTNQPEGLAVPMRQPSFIAQASQQVTNAQLIAANTRLSFKLFSEILKQQPDQNIFISPASVAIALAMTYNGAKGETQQAIAHTLELEGMSLEEVNQAYATLRATLTNPDPTVQLSIANSLWGRQGEPFNPEFLQKNQTFYGTQVTSLDFTNSTASDVINNWVKQSTNGKIDKIVDSHEFSPDTILVLLNAIYFKGFWTRAFDKTSTKELPFTLLNGTQKSHPIMFQESEYWYYENELFQAVSLPYGQGRLSLYIFLPHKNVSLKTFYQKLNAESWEQWMSEFTPEQVLLGLPRFKLDYELELNNALKSLGMAIAFEPNRADFSGITSRPAYISKVKHNTFFEVNEEGSEAAGAASVQVNTRSSRQASQMTVDRPFFCAIFDNQTKSILFMGSILEP